MFVTGRTVEKSCSKPKHNDQRSMMQETLEKKGQKMDERPYSS